MSGPRGDISGKTQLLVTVTPCVLTPQQRQSPVSLSSALSAVATVSQ